jgi:hypothetical protein
MQIIIHDAENAEPKFLGEVLTRIAHHQHVETVDVYVNKRDHDGRRNPMGWIEYLVQFTYTTGGKFTLGCLQRGFNEPTEFHS